MTDRRTWSIAVKFARQRDGQPCLSSVHWSPPREEWSRETQIAVDCLKRDMAHSIHDAAVTDVSDAREDR